MKGRNISSGRGSDRRACFPRRLASALSPNWKKSWKNFATPPSWFSPLLTPSGSSCWWPLSRRRTSRYWVQMSWGWFSCVSTAFLSSCSSSRSCGTGAWPLVTCSHVRRGSEARITWFGRLTMPSCCRPSRPSPFWTTSAKIAAANTAGAAQGEAAGRQMLGSRSHCWMMGQRTGTTATEAHEAPHHFRSKLGSVRHFRSNLGSVCHFRSYLRSII